MEQKEQVTPHDDPDVQLMLRFQQGDMAAFQQLFNRYTSSVVNFAFRFVHSRERAEELAQEVFLQVYRWQNRYEPKAKFSTWLFKIANNHCLNEVRKGEYRVSHESLDSQTNDEGRAVKYSSGSLLLRHTVSEFPRTQIASSWRLSE